MLNVRFEPRWWYGGPWDIWVRRVDVIRKFVEEHKLKAVVPEDLPVHPHGFEVMEVQARPGLRPRPFPGGIVGPHLHLKGEIFLLNGEQWRTFSTGIVREYSERLKAAGSVGFQELMDVSATIERL